MNWHAGWLTGFDVESSGVDPRRDRIVSATVVHVHGSDRSKKPIINRWLVNPGIEIPDGATAVHGITTERARTEGMPPVEVLPQILDQLAHATVNGHPVVVYNARYDMTMLRSECVRHGLGADAVPQPAIVDPLVLDKQLDRYRKGSRKLVDVAAHYRVALDGAHDDTQDALAAARLAWRMAQHADIRGMSLSELHTAQIKWAADQAASFQEYRRKTDPTAIIEGQWPALPEIEPAVCRSERCRAEIVFAPTEDGRTIPLDCAPDPTGTVVYLGPVGARVAHVLASGEPAPEGPRFMPHHATCPGVEEFRGTGT